MNSDQNKVINFILSNKNYYTDYLKPEIQKKIKYGYTSDINQIYCHLELVEYENTDYYEFYKIIKNNFNITNKKILDAACGLIPVISNIINYKEKCVIKAVDKKIIFKNYNGILTEEADLNKTYDFNDYDLIIGFRPCYVTENIIINAIQSKKDFCIYMCPCILKPQNNHLKGRWSKNRWYNYLENLIRSSNNYDLTITRNNNLEDDCPIFIGKYKKQ